MFDLLCWEFIIIKYENMYDMEGNKLMDVIVVGVGLSGRYIFILCCMKLYVVIVMF